MSAGTVKNEVKDAVNSEANIAKTADEAAQALKNENVAKDVDNGVTKIGSPISKRTEIYINLRNETQRKLEEWLSIANDSKNKTLSKKQLKPAFSTSYNEKTKKYYYAKNLSKDEVTKEKTIYHPYEKERIENMDKEIYESYKDMTHGAGSHAECLTLNESMLDQFCIENNIGRETLTQDVIDNLHNESPELFKQDT